MPRVLLLDDEVIISMMMQDWLADLDCEAVGPAHSVASALSLVKSESFDAAVLDLSLAKENSAAVADELRARNVPFAFATGYNARDLPERHKDAVILTKPFDFNGFRNTIDQLLRAGGHSVNRNFLPMRREASGGYSTLGPVGHAMSLTEARGEVMRLKRSFKEQDFVIMAEVGSATHEVSMDVRLSSPRKKRALPDNVVPIRRRDAH
jgi:CheY-like chemotaxis protein